MYLYSLFILLCAGLGVSSYLVYKHFISTRKPMICPITHDCSKVTESRWNTVFFGIRNDVLGMLFYIGMIAMNSAVLFAPDYTEIAYGLNVIGEAGAAAFSLFLVGVQMFILREYCFWCLTLSGINFLLLANTIVLALPYYG